MKQFIEENAAGLAIIIVGTICWIDFFLCASSSATYTVNL